MSKLSWDNVGERFYETGVDRGVIYPFKTVNGTAGYQKGAAWNGLTQVSENPSGAEATALYADNIKYLNLISNEEFGATVEAYTYPEEFGECDGSVEPADGVFLNQQKRKPFGMTYRTKIGNDVDGSDKGYKIHLVYNALAAPSSKSYGTINDSPEAITFSWELTTTPVPFEIYTDYKPVAHIVIDSTKITEANLTTLENKLYGTDGSGSATGTDPELPTPDALLALLGVTPPSNG